MKYFFIFFSLISINIYAQVSVSVDSVFFNTVIKGETDSISFYLKNVSGETLELSLKNFNYVYTISDSTVTIPSFDSSLITIKFQPQQNVTERDLIEIKNDIGSAGLYLRVSGHGLFGDSYDATTFNLYDTQLKSALTTLVSGHTSLGYNLARDKMFMDIDNKKVNGQGAPVNTLECVYTGREAIGYTDRTNAQNNYNFNTEHTWPQSNFSENEPMRSDLFHLFPTDANANNIRANYPFGNVVSAITWDSAGSKLGRNSLNQIVFEPRDVHKGDVSRSMFYFIIRYPQNYGGFFTLVQENVFREWNILDDVGAIESARNSAIASFQMKRNPFIDHPEFAERIYSFVSNNIRPVTSELLGLPLSINYDSVSVGDSASGFFYAANKGSGILLIDSVSVAGSCFSVQTQTFSIAPNSVFIYQLLFKPDSAISYSGSATFYSVSGNVIVNLSGEGKQNAVSVDDVSIEVKNFKLEQNFPNPFNPSTRIKYSVPSDFNGQTLKVKLVIYNILGMEVATLVNENKAAGEYEILFDSASFGGGLPSGVYMYKLEAGSGVETKKMILIK